MLLKFQQENTQERDLLEDLGANENTILELILNNWISMWSIRWIQLKMGTSGEPM